MRHVRLEVTIDDEAVEDNCLSSLISLFDPVIVVIDAIVSSCVLAIPLAVYAATAEVVGCSSLSLNSKFLTPTLNVPAGILNVPEIEPASSVTEDELHTTCAETSILSKYGIIIDPGLNCVPENDTALALIQGTNDTSTTLSPKLSVLVFSTKFLCTPVLVWSIVVVDVILIPISLVRVLSRREKVLLNALPVIETPMLFVCQEFHSVFQPLKLPGNAASQAPLLEPISTTRSALRVVSTH